MLFNKLYNIIALKMNKFVNHKYRSNFDNSLISKIFIFQFVNSFNSIIIIAFLKKYIIELGGCVKKIKINEEIIDTLSKDNYCDEEIYQQLLIIALINFLTNISEVK
jgi:hypothetical protein